jgi:electron transfer flavoprotein alpha subunit
LTRPLRIAALVKQIPAFEEMRLGPDGRLLREGLELEMNPYCRRAVSKAVELAGACSGEVVVLTLGPPAAEDTLREALAWAAEHGVDAGAVLVTDPAFAGSDTLATAKALAAALTLEGPFDLVLVGRNSVDADTGQVGPETAELLDLAFVTGVRELELDGDTVRARCEHDDGWVRAELRLPAIVSVAERLCEPCKMDDGARAAVPGEKIRRRTAAELGPGPWGVDASPTRVGSVRVHEVSREHLVLDGPVPEQVGRAAAFLRDRGALDVTPPSERHAESVPAPAPGGGPTVVAVAEPGRDHMTRELLGEAAGLAARMHGRVVAFTVDGSATGALGVWGADVEVRAAGISVEEDVADALGRWSAESQPWAILAPSTAWGREVASRAAARLGAGLTGDAVGLGEDGGRLVAWKPAFGGQLVAAITADSPIQMATVRDGVLPLLAPRRHDAPVDVIPTSTRGRVKVLSRERDDDLDVLAEADVVVGVGTGVPPDDYDNLRPLLEALGAELAATRKVTDNGWLPRARQVGITGRSVAPRLYIAVGVAGKFNHMVGVRAAGTVLAINSDPGALVFGCSDIGIVGDWREVIPLLVAALSEDPRPLSMRA